MEADVSSYSEAGDDENEYTALKTDWKILEITAGTPTKFYLMPWQAGRVLLGVKYLCSGSEMTFMKNTYGNTTPERCRNT